MSKKVLIDITPTLPGKASGFVGNYISGIGQAAISLVNALNRLEDIPYDIELYVSSSMAMHCNFFDWKFKHHKLPLPKKFSYFFNIEPYIRGVLFKADLYHITTNYANVLPHEPFVVTIHDCTDMDESFSDDIGKELRKFRHKKYYQMTRDSKAIITISEYSKMEILKYFDVNPDKVIVNYHGIDRDKYKVLPTDVVYSVLEKFQITQPYFFACSCSRPRKNLKTALNAFKKFLTYNPDYIFVAAWENPTVEIKKEFVNEIESGKIRFLPFLTDDELVALYNGAALSVYVSRKEGFGLPILESFACGTPVMTCNNSSLPEVGQDAAIYVGEDNADEMVDVMRMFQLDRYDSAEFKIKSEKVLNKFSWDNTAKRCVNIYTSILG